jgi:hypothetical protein
LELLKDSYGKELVISELTRINYGILVSELLTSRNEKMRRF